MKSLILLDLFSGMGGFPHGFIRAGYTFRKHYFSEIDKYAIANYYYNFNEAEYVGSIEQIKKGSIEKPDIVAFGFPCQDVSILGKRKGLKGSRSNLFFEAIRIVKQYRPAVFIFENVKGLFSSNEGKDFKTILEEIANIGLYDCEWQLLNTRWFLPQNRERIFFIGHLRGESSPKVFPFTEDHFSPAAEQKGEVAYAIIATRGSRNNDTYVTNARFTNARRLTPLECERLQGFPDNWTRYGLVDNQLIEISDTQRYKLVGNAVSVPVVEAIARRLIKPELRQQLLGISKSQMYVLELEALALRIELELLEFAA